MCLPLQQLPKPPKSPGVYAAHSSLYSICWLVAGAFFDLGTAHIPGQTSSPQNKGSCKAICVVAMGSVRTGPSQRVKEGARMSVWWPW